MKPNELMIGDWIKVLPISHKVEPHYDRIESIRKEYTGEVYIEGGYHDREHKEICDWFDWSVGLAYIEPIPLTAEIFEKNDWYQGECRGETLYFIPNKAFYLANSYKKGYMAIGVLIDGKMLNLFNIKYVHKLQHALRLVGLNEVADNLKV